MFIRPRSTPAISISARCPTDPFRDTVRKRDTQRLITPFRTLVQIARTSFLMPDAGPWSRSVKSSPRFTRASQRAVARFTARRDDEGSTILNYLRDLVSMRSERSNTRTSVFSFVGSARLQQTKCVRTKNQQISSHRAVPTHSFQADGPFDFDPWRGPTHSTSPPLTNSPSTPSPSPSDPTQPSQPPPSTSTLAYR